MDPLGALAPEEAPSWAQQQGPPRQQQQAQSWDPPAVAAAAAAASATASAAAASAAAAIRSAAAAIRTAAEKLPSLPQQQQQTQELRHQGSGSASSTPTAAAATDPLQQQPPAPPRLSPAERAEQFRSLLAADTVDIRALQAAAASGVPDEPAGLRASVWRMLLGVLPPERSLWERSLRRKRAEYAQFCEELIVDPNQLSGSRLEAAPGSHPNPLSGASSSSSSMQQEAADVGGVGGGAVAAAAAAAGESPSSAVGAAAAQALQRLALSSDDHPLSTSSSSRWKAYFQDVEVQEQIERDVARTHPDMHFFSGPGGAPAEHRAQMRRALFVFAKLNPGLRYVQGMNELFAPLYWLFKTDPAPGAAEHAEPDAFWAFTDLLGELRDHFCQQLDDSTEGIRATLGRLSALLRAHDEPLWEHLERKCAVNPQFYAFRWITLALTQEFPFPDALRLWDSLLSDPAGRADCLLRLCVAMLLHVRRQLLEGDFAACMKLLQRYPPVDVALLTRSAEALKAGPKTVIVLD